MITTEEFLTEVFDKEDEFTLVSDKQLRTYIQTLRRWEALAKKNQKTINEQAKRIESHETIVDGWRTANASLQLKLGINYKKLDLKC